MRVNDPVRGDGGKFVVLKTPAEAKKKRQRSPPNSPSLALVCLSGLWLPLDH